MEGNLSPGTDESLDLNEDPNFPLSLFRHHHTRGRDAAVVSSGVFEWSRELII